MYTHRLVIIHNTL